MPDPQLRIRVTADTTDAQRGVSGLEGSFTELYSAVGLIRQGIEIASGVISSAITPILDYSAEVRRLSNFTGDTTENTSALIQVASDFGVEVGPLETALRNMATNGLSPTLDGVIALSDEFRGTSDADRPEWLIRQFGRAGQEMANMMAGGPELIRQMADAVGETTLSLSDLDQQQIAELAVAFNDWEQAMLAIKMSLVETGALGALANMVNEVAAALTRLTDALRGARAGDWSGIQEMLGQAGTVIYGMEPSVRAGTVAPATMPGVMQPGRTRTHGYQSGGRLQPGYNMVGEAGPELLTPSGHVIPAGNDALLDEMRRVRGEIANLAQTLPTIMRDAVERLV